MGLSVEFICNQLGIEVPTGYAKLVNSCFDNVEKRFDLTLAVYGKPPQSDTQQPLRLINLTISGKPTVSTERYAVKVPFIEGDPNPEGCRVEWQEKTVLTPVPAWELALYRELEAANASIAYRFIKQQPINGTDFALAITDDHEDNSHHVTCPESNAVNPAGSGTASQPDPGQPDPAAGHPDQPVDGQP